MPQQITKFKVFISSPANLDAERAIIAKVLALLSEEFRSDYDVEFDVFNWKDDAVPGIGVNAQAVVSSQLNYDIYVGLMGVVFGTPTQAAGSGTEEEFNDAYSRYQSNPESVRVLFYFNKRADDVFDLDTEQLHKVKHFRTALGPRGVLYHDFKGFDSLGEIVRSHFRSLIREQWDGSVWRVISPPSAPSQASSCTLVTLPPVNMRLMADEKPGLYDLVAMSSDASKDFAGHMRRMTVLANKLSSTISTQGTNLQDLEIATQGARLAIEYSDRIALGMDEYTSATGPELVIFQKTASDMVSTLDGVATLYFSEKTGSKEQIVEILDSFKGLIGTTRAVRSTLEKFRELLERIPIMSKKVRSSKKYLIRSVDDFIASYTIFISSADELAEKIEAGLSQS